MSVNEILKSMLVLPIEERIFLTDMLTQSLNPMDRNVEKNWINEVEKRLVSLDNGDLKTISYEEFFDEH